MRVLHLWALPSEAGKRARGCVHHVRERPSLHLWSEDVKRDGDDGPASVKEGRQIIIKIKMRLATLTGTVLLPGLSDLINLSDKFRIAPRSISWIFLVFIWMLSKRL